MALYPLRMNKSNMLFSTVTPESTLVITCSAIFSMLLAMIITMSTTILYTRWVFVHERIIVIYCGMFQSHQKLMLPIDKYPIKLAVIVMYKRQQPTNQLSHWFLYLYSLVTRISWQHTLFCINWKLQYPNAAPKIGFFSTPLSFFQRNLTSIGLFQGFSSCSFNFNLG